MNEVEKHFSLIEKPFNVDNVRTIFNDKDLKFLKKYGSWMEGLYLGNLKPISDEQKEFIRLMNYNKPPDKNEFKIFWRYLRRVELLKTQNLNNEKKLILDDREDWKKIRRSRF
ncbi:MAG: DUF413 domain-containing protein [Flavobacteriaceae bacterium]